MSSYEVVIIGAGPAGLFAALKLVDSGAGRVLLVEQGPALEERRRDQPGGLLCGWGGAGAFSDGKLILSPEVGGFLSELLPLKELTALIREVDGIYQHWGRRPNSMGATPIPWNFLRLRPVMPG